MERDTESSFEGVPGALIRMGCAFMDSGQGTQAHELLGRLMLAHPEDPELQSAARLILSHGVPNWHARMLLDQDRNEAVERAILRAVPSKRSVLDIGTGSGLLALMAARAGASKVVACEANAALAHTARAIIHANGYLGTIVVLGKRSTELDVELDLGGRVDLIIAEVFSNNLLAEGALATLRHAKTQLGTKGVQIIPAQASMRFALAHYDEIRTSLSAVRGFDLSKFELHVSPHKNLQIGDKGLRLTSKPEDLFAFDFTSDARLTLAKREILVTSTEGPSNGLVQWIRLQLDDETTYENCPRAGAKSHWAAVFHPFGHGKTVEQGSSVTVHAVHDHERVQIWFS